jgi:hypothetical protein
MSSKVRIVKRQEANESPVAVQDVVKSEQQRNREIVGVIKGWIDEFRLRSAANSQAALAFINK